MTDPTVLEAVKALLFHQTDADAIAQGGTAAFVQIARPIYKAAGFAFSDDDLRNIHDGLRIACARRARPGAS